jgi:hypothetical protein
MEDCKFNRVPSILSIQDDDFLNHWNLGQVIHAKGILDSNASKNFNNFHKECNDFNLIPNFEIHQSPLSIKTLSKLEREAYL